MDWTHHMRVLDLLEHLDVVELDVEVLVDALEDAADLDVVFELDRDLVVDEGFEEAGVVLECRLLRCVWVCVCVCVWEKCVRAWGMMLAIWEGGAWYGSG